MAGSHQAAERCHQELPQPKLLYFQGGESQAGLLQGRGVGIGYGGGRQVPGNVKISGQVNQEEMRKLMADPSMQRVVGFSNCERHPFIFATLSLIFYPSSF